MISIFINSLTSGGAEKVVLTLFDSFRQSGENVELIFIEHERFYEIPKEAKSTYLTRFQSLENSFFKLPYLFFCALRLKKHVKKNNSKIVQSHLLRASFINVISRIFGSRHHSQVVIHSRINFDHKFLIYRLFSKWIYRFVLERADSVISICETMKLELDQYIGLENHPKHRIIYNPHDLTALQKLASQKVNDFLFSKDKKYLISVGRIVKGKRIDDLINAFYVVRKSFPELELIIIGDGPEKVPLEKLACDLNLNNIIHFKGYQSNPFAYIAKSDIMILSSEWEGLPNIIIEALACKTPVISADCISGPREILNPASDLRFQLKKELEYGEYGLLYPIGNIDLLAKAISELLCNENLQKDYIQKSLKRAKDFDVGKIKERYLSTFLNSHT